MNPYTVLVNSKKVKINEIEFLYYYENQDKEKFVVFEYEGNKYESKVENEQTE